VGGLLGLVLVLALIVWVVRPRRPAFPAPEDDLTTPVDREELEAAERELLQDPTPLSIEGEFDDDDWGPGAPRSP